MDDFRQPHSDQRSPARRFHLNLKTIPAERGRGVCAAFTPRTPFRSAVKSQRCRCPDDQTENLPDTFIIDIQTSRHGASCPASLFFPAEFFQEPESIRRFVRKNFHAADAAVCDNWKRCILSVLQTISPFLTVKLLIVISAATLRTMRTDDAVFGIHDGNPSVYGDLRQKLTGTERCVRQKLSEIFHAELIG